MWNTESLALEFGIQQGIRNSTAKDWNPVNGIRNPVSEAWNPEFKTALHSLTRGDACSLSALACSTRNLFKKQSNMRCGQEESICLMLHLSPI